MYVSNDPAVEDSQTGHADSISKAGICRPFRPDGENYVQTAK